MRQILLNGGAGYAETNEPNLKHFALIDDLVTGGVDPLSIFSQLTPTVAQKNLRRMNPKP